MSKFIDMTGQKIGKWTVLERAQNGAAGGTRWLCRCDCGIIKSVAGGTLRNGTSSSCGCDRIERVRFSKGHTKNEVGNRYGSLMVVEWIKDISIERKSAYWLCQCDCGNTTVARGSDLRFGKIISCGCKSGKRDKSGERYGMLTVIEKVSGGKYLCKCDCGNYTTVLTGHLTSGATQSCGCSRSRGEHAILQFLIKNNIPYIYQYISKEIKYNNGNYPRFDFALLNEKNDVIAILEYQGDIHYKTRNSGWNTQEFLENTQQRDAEKRILCQKLGIPLYEIPYWEYDDLESSLKNIISATKMED